MEDAHWARNGKWHSALLEALWTHHPPKPHYSSTNPESSLKPLERQLCSPQHIIRSLISHCLETLEDLCGWLNQWCLVQPLVVRVKLTCIYPCPMYLNLYFYSL